jgi:hypothetical protein
MLQLIAYLVTIILTIAFIFMVFDIIRQFINIKIGDIKECWRNALDVEKTQPHGNGDVN